MILAKTIPPPDRASSAAADDPLQSTGDLFGGATVRCEAVQLEAPTANSGVLSYGSKEHRPMTLAAGEKTEVLPIKNLNDLYITGNGTDTVGVLVFI